MEIDRLDIAIEAQAKQVASEVDTLYNKLGNIANVLNRTSSSYRTAAHEAGRFVSSIRALSGVRVPDFSRLASQIKKISNMGTFDAGKFDALITGIQSLAGMPDISRSINGLVNGLTRLSKAGSNISDAASALPALGSALRDIFTSLSQTDVSTQISMLVSGIARLGTNAPKIEAAAQALPALTAQIRAYIDSMANAPVASDNTTQLVTAFAQLATDGRRISSIGRQVSQSLGDISRSGNTASTSMDKVHGSSNKLMDALRGLANACKSVVGGIGSAAGKIVGHFKKIASGSNHITKATLSLKNLLQVSLGFYGIRSLINFGKQAVELSSDLTEVQNVVENSFGTKGTEAVEKFAQSSIQNLGMSELTAKQVSSRFQAMGNAMGITAGQVANATSSVADRMADSYDRAGDSMGAMSLNLTRLTADMASFYNVEQDTVAEALNAVYTGQTRPLRQYGLDLTQATLQEWAMKQGIDADMQSMSQAEKTLLRYQYVMANTATVQGDFARTSQTWANQVRILRQNFEVLGRIIGDVAINAFRPLVVWLNTAMSQVIAFAETIGNALGKIFGWQIQHTPASNAADVYSTLADSLEDTSDAGDGTADSLKDAKKAADAYKNTVLGFDELNKLNDVNETTSTPNSGGGSGSGGSGGGLPGVSGQGADFTVTRQPTWFEDYKSEIDTLEELGEYISEKLTAAMDKIQWNNIFEKARGFGTGLASFLNGLITPELFSAMGGTIANAINTILNAEDAFLNKFNFKNLGKSIGSGINTFFSTYNFDLKAKTFYKLINGIIDTINSAATEIRWGSIGTKISGLVRNALDGINWKNAYSAVGNFASGIANFLNGLFDERTFATIGTTISELLNTAIHGLDSFGETFNWENFGSSIGTGIENFFDRFNFTELADTLNKWARGILVSVRAALRTPNWFEIGEKIGNFIKNINWTKAFVGIATVVADTMNVVIETAKGFFSVDSLGEPFTKALDSIQKTCEEFVKAVDWEKLASSVGKLVDALAPAAEGFAVGLSDAFKVLADIGAATLNAIGKVFEAIADAINSLPEGVVRKFGEDLGFVAGAFVTIKGATAVSGIIKNVVGTLTGYGTAAASAATATGTLAGTASGASGSVGSFAGELLKAGGWFPAAIAGAVQLGEGLQTTDEIARGENGTLTEMGGIMDSIAAQFAPDMAQEIRNVKNDLENSGYTADSAAQEFAKFFTGKGVSPATLENALARVQGQINVTDEQSKILDKTLELMGEQFDASATSANLSKEDYRKFKDVIGELVKEGTLGGDMALELDRVLQQQVGVGTANQAYEALVGTMSDMGIETDTLEQKAKEKFPGIFSPISEGAEKANEKSGSLKTDIWAFAGGIAAQSILMALMGTTFKNIGDKAEKTESPIENLKKKISVFASSIKDNAPVAEDGARDVMDGAVFGFSDELKAELRTIVGCGDDFCSAFEDTVTGPQNFNMNSPSKTTAGWASNVILGFSNSIASNLHKITEAAKSLFGAFDTQYSNYKATLYSKGASIISELDRGMKSVRITLSNMINFDTATLNSNMWSAGLNAASSFANAIKSYRMPGIQFYISGYNTHDTNGDGYWDYQSPVFTPYWYAKGGFPNTGEMFIANENGPEMVGRMGHKNVVANNMQIAEGIKAAVVDGMMEASMSGAFGGSGSGSAPFVLNATIKTMDDEVLARVVEKGQARRNARFNTVASPI